MPEPTALHFGPFSLLSRNGPLLRGGQEIKLQRKALATLWTLARQAGEVVTRSALLSAAWPGLVVGDDALTFQIKAIRRAVEDDPRAPRYIVTAHRVGFRFAMPVRVASAAAAAEPPASEPADVFVGRRPEMDALESALDKAGQGKRQLIFVGGEPGIGKTGLLAAFLSRVQGRSSEWLIGRGQCVEQQGAAEAYLPVLEALGHLLRQAADERPLELMKHAAPSWLMQLPSLLSADELATLKRQSRGVSRERLLSELAEVLEQMSVLQPIVLVLEDLHWSDPATLDLLAILGRRTQPARLLILATYRPVDAIIGEHPVRHVLASLKSAQRASELLLGYLDAAAVDSYLQQRRGADGASTASRQALSRSLYVRSGGHPLFMTQLYDYLAQRGDGVLSGPASDALPQALQDLIALQFAQLEPEDQALLEVASVAGMEFAAASVAACSGEPAEAVERRCDRLVRQGRFVSDHGLAIWPDGTSSGRYRFRHVLYEQAIRGQLSSARCARLHRQLAETLEQAYGARVEEIAGELLHHYEQAGVADKTVRYCIELARIAILRAADEEVLLQTERGLRWLALLPAGEARDEGEMALHTQAAIALQARHGSHAEAATPHLQIIERLLATVQNPVLLAEALPALWRSAHNRGESDRSLNFAARIVEFGRSQASPLLESFGQSVASLTFNVVGRHLESGAAAAQGVRLSDQALQQQPQLLTLEPCCTSRAARALSDWHLGFPDQALRYAYEAKTHAILLGNPYVTCLHVAGVLGSLLLMRREWQELKRCSVEAIALCEKHGHEDGLQFATQQWLIARSFLGEAEQALPALLASVDRERLDGCMGRSIVMCYVHAAEAATKIAQWDVAHRALDSADQLIERYGPRTWEPEIWRARGELILARGPDRAAEAQASFQRALNITRERQGRSLELRASLSLARLWASQARGAEARVLLQAICDWFTDGLGTADLLEARRLLDSWR